MTWSIKLLINNHYECKQSSISYFIYYNCFNNTFVLNIVYKEGLKVNIYYFAYGTNLNKKIFLKKFRNARLVKKHTLNNFKVVFRTKYNS